MTNMLYVVDKTLGEQQTFDIYSRLLRERIVFLTGTIDSETANMIIAQMFYLEAEDPKQDVKLYINSCGGSMTSGYAILDTMQFIKPNVSTFCIGTAYSMASVLLMAGKKGKRYALPHSEVLLHQPLGGCSGQASDIEIHAKNILRMREEMYGVVEKFTDLEREKIVSITDRDTYLTAHQALEYGIIDKIIKTEPA